MHFGRPWLTVDRLRGKMNSKFPSRIQLFILKFSLPILVFLEVKEGDFHALQKNHNDKNKHQLRAKNKYSDGHAVGKE